MVNQMVLNIYFHLLIIMLSPDCCGHSNISSDMGCVCYSPEQLKMIRNRGSNVKDAMTYPDIYNN